MDTIGCNCCFVPGTLVWDGMIGEDLVSLCPSCYSVLIVSGVFTDPWGCCIVSARRFVRAVRAHYDWVRDETALLQAEIDAEAKNEVGPDDAEEA